MSNCVKVTLHYMLITWLLLLLLTGAMPNGFLRQVSELGCYFSPPVNEFFVSATQKKKKTLYISRQKQTLIRTVLIIIKILLYLGNSSEFSVSAVPPRSCGWGEGGLRLTWVPCPVAAGLSLLGDLTSIGTVTKEMKNTTQNCNFKSHLFIIVCLSEAFLSFTIIYHRMWNYISTYWHIWM